MLPCRRCGKPIERQGRGRPRVQHDVCPGEPDPDDLPEFVPQGIPGPPFSSPLLADVRTREPAPVLEAGDILKYGRGLFSVPVEPSAVHDPGPARDPNQPYTPGPIEQKLLDDMATMTTTNPLAGVLGQAAIRCARAADLADPADYKAVLAPLKELRSLVVEMTKTASGGDDDEEGQPDTVFGWGNPEVVNAPAV